MLYLLQRKRKFLNSKYDIDSVPCHVAIIMDGNGTWATKKFMNRIKGHEKGSIAVHSIVNICLELGIKFLTLYAFSTENWARSDHEVFALMNLLKKFAQSERKQLFEQNVCLKLIGQKKRLPENVRKELDITIDKTKKNNKMFLTLAISYGGREEITRAVKKIAKKAIKKKISYNEITENMIAEHLYTKNMPDPDLLIRTSGKMRLSNFLLWQMAYTEIFITDTLWPDFTKQEFIDIIKNYQTRDRKFGKVYAP